MKITRSIKTATLVILLVLSVFLAYSYAAVTQIVGTAVQQSGIWNNVKDAATGDNLTTGVPVSGLYAFDGTNWDRIRGSIANGLLVDVSRVTGTVTISGATTPADGFANPTNAVTSFGLMGMWNGASWDRLRGDIANGLDVDVTRLPNTAADNSANSTAKLPVLSARANAAAPAWTEGNQVPLSVDLTGALRVSTGATTLPTTFTHAQVAVTAVATLITASDASRLSAVIRNIGANPAYIGSTVGVTTANGFLLYPNESLTLDKNTGDIYAICGAALTTTIAYVKE